MNGEPELDPTAPLLSVRGLRKTYRTAGGEVLVAVDDVSFSIDPGEAVALVGESGSGKSTCARLVVGLENPTAGEIEISGRSYAPGAGRDEVRRRARLVQLVFQDPYSSLDPRQRVGAALREVLHFHFGLDRAAQEVRVSELLQMVGLDAHHAEALPRTLSGGQRQRVAIARALAAEPRLLVLDEAVAALDVSIQAQVLSLLRDVRQATGVGLLFITHDLAVAELMSDRVLVMRRGQVVEAGATSHVLTAPSHPYTQQLLDAVPRRNWRPTRRTARAGIDPTEER